MTDTATKRFLFVDTNRDWLQFVSSTLNDGPFQVEVATDLLETLERYKSGVYDALFIGLDQARAYGELLHQMATKDGRHIVILVPGTVDAQLARAFFRQGMRDVLGKPYGAEELTDMISVQISSIARRLTAPRPAANHAEYTRRTRRLRESVLSDQRGIVQAGSGC